MVQFSFKLGIGLAGFLLAAFGTSVLASTSNTIAPEAWHELEIPGGIAALCNVAGIDPATPRGRVMLELTRRLYTSRNLNESPDLEVRVRQYLDVVSQFATALTEVQGNGSGLTLRVALNGRHREAFARLLDASGYKLLEQARPTGIQPIASDEAERRRVLLEGVGVPVAEFERKLRVGEPVVLDLKRDSVPLPLPPARWAAILKQPVEPDGLARAIVTNRGAALLYHGLVSLDAETLAFFERTPDLLDDIYREQAGTFSTFARSLRIRQGRVEVPDGEIARPIWEAIVGEQVTKPARFVRKLFTENAGRLAYFYDAVGQLDDAHARFAMSAATKDPRARLDRVKELYRVFIAADQEWKPNLVPFARPPIDPGFVLGQLSVSPSGELSTPVWRRLWQLTFEGEGPPDPSDGKLTALDAEGVIDAAWITEQVCLSPRSVKQSRLEALLFAGRIFGDAKQNAAPAIRVALSGFFRYPTLMLTLERIGVRTPALYAAAAQHAGRLSRLTAAAAEIALAHFQGLVAIIERARFARIVDPDVAGRLIGSLANLQLDEGEGYGAQTAAWIDRDLLPAFAAATGSRFPGDSPESIVLRAMAGAVRGAPLDRYRTVEWEDFSYRVDPGASELLRLGKVREKQSGSSLDAALEICRAGAILSDANSHSNQWAGAVYSLKRSLEMLTRAAPPGASGSGGTDGASEIEGILNDLGSIGPAGDRKKFEKLGQSVRALGNRQLADVLKSLVYAAYIGDPGGQVLLAGNVAVRHTFGLRAASAEERARTPWSIPNEVTGPGETWRASGSLLAFNVGLPWFALRRISDQSPVKPALNENDSAAFAQTVALMNPFDLTDDGMSFLANAIRSGRDRVRRLSPGSADVIAVADAAGLTEGRRQLLGWTLTHEPERRLDVFSMFELFQVGRPDGPLPAGLEAWGVSAVTSSGCLCLRFPPLGPYEVFTGRPPRGLLAGTLADLNLFVAETLDGLHLPATLAPGVLAALTQDFIDQVQPAYHDDWFALVRHARSFSRDTMIDYVSALTAIGPLVPASDPGVISPVR